jgi:hypothetical protein
VRRAVRTHVYRYVTWGDTRHWELTIGRVKLSRWCSGAPCHLPRTGDRHPVRVGLWHRAYAARYGR